MKSHAELNIECVWGVKCARGRLSRSYPTLGRAIQFGCGLCRTICWGPWRKLLSDRLWEAWQGEAGRGVPYRVTVAVSHYVKNENCDRLRQRQLQTNVGGIIVACMSLSGIRWRRRIRDSKTRFPPITEIIKKMPYPAII